jgi:hypothetical protein
MNIRAKASWLHVTRATKNFFVGGFEQDSQEERIVGI